MGNPEEIELSLPAVKEKFLEAQEKLQGIARSLQQLSSSTEEVREARATLEQGLTELRETAGANRQLAEGLRDASEHLAQATGLLENLDPQRLLERIGTVEQAIQSALAAHAESSSKIESRLSDLGTRQAEAARGMNDNLSELRSATTEQINALEANQAEQLEKVDAAIAASKHLLWAVLVVQLLLAAGLIFQLLK